MVLIVTGALRTVLIGMKERLEKNWATELLRLAGILRKLLET